MTANQIAARSEREGERHNQVSEEEIQRHNQETERLQNDANEITRTHNQVMASLQEDYNKAYIAYLNAAEEDKVQLETQLNWIKEQQMDADRTYKQEMSIISSAQQRADEMYKTGMLELQSENTDIEWKRAYYANQKTEAETAYTRVQMDLAEKRFQAEVDKINKEYELGLIDADIRMKQLKLAQNKHDLDLARFQDIELPESTARIELQKAQKTKAYADVATEAVRASSDVIDSILPF